jgi:hypothetical protein
MRNVLGDLFTIVLVPIVVLALGVLFTILISRS